MKIATRAHDLADEHFVDHWCATDPAGREFYAPTEAEATAMALDYNRPRKGASRAEQLAAERSEPQ